MSVDFQCVVDRTTTNAEKYRLRQKLFKTENVLPMWVADMDIETPPCIVKAVQKRAAHPIYGYEEVPLSAYEAQIAWMKKRHGVTIKREWMFYSHSVVATINTAIQAYTKPGDKVIVQTPIYPPFLSNVARNGREVLRNPLHRSDDGDYTFDLDDLRSKIDADTKLLLLCSPHNPVGRVWSQTELQGLADICLEHNIKVVADEIHSDLVYAPHKHIPFASLSEAVANITITAIGPGKTFNTAGLAISTVVVQNELMREAFDDAYERIHFAQGNIFAHAGFEAAYREGEQWLDELLIHLQRNIEKLTSLAQRHSDKIRFIEPQGTYLAWLDCSGLGLGSSELKRFFVEEAALGLSPGVSFGKEGRGYMRLNFAVPGPIMDDAIALLDLALSNFDEY
ncbi:MAG: PatB family C-S lyase [Helicobacteraceae bacterium]|nr:PatB family C-S lyase [Helicobacteraceae bacterium]